MQNPIRQYREIAFDDYVSFFATKFAKFQPAQPLYGRAHLSAPINSIHFGHAYICSRTTAELEQPASQYVVVKR